MTSLLPDMKQNLLLYFQVHQPLRLRKFRFFDIGSNGWYFDESLNYSIMERIARECYLPANELLLSMIREHPQLKITFSISGITLYQFHEYFPDVLESFRALAATGSVEFLGETNYHSLACMIPGHEFEQQALEHIENLNKYLSIRPQVFRNTELIYNNDIAARVNTLGFRGMLCDGVDEILGDRSPHHVYEHPDHPESKLLPRSYRLSDDIAFRFKQGTSSRLTVHKYLSWLNGIPSRDEIVNLGMDYETFGEHQKRETGIFQFLKKLLKALAKQKRFKMLTASEAIQTLPSRGPLYVPGFISWADRERDLSAWLGNAMQQDAFDSVVSLESEVKRLNDRRLLKVWRCLLTSDHLYYMSTKKNDDGNIHSYFSPYPSPYEAFINYMNVLSDFTDTIQKQTASNHQREEEIFAHLIS